MMNKTNKPFAEIIESSLTHWTAQCWQWDVVPHFGSLVIVPYNNTEIFGLTYRVQTASSDPSRAPFAYQKTNEELQRDHPQIFELLKTTFTCIILGYQQKNIRYQLAPKPVKIHSFVTLASLPHAQQFFSSSQWLHTFFGATEIDRRDELLLAVLENYGNGLLKPENIEKFIDAYCLFTSNEYRHTKLFLQRLTTIAQ